MVQESDIPPLNISCLKEKRMSNLLSPSIFYELRSSGISCSDICKRYNSLCPVAYASLLKNIEWINDSIVYKGNNFSRKTFEDTPNFSEVSRRTGVDRTLVYYIGKILEISIDKHDSLKYRRSRFGDLSFSEYQIIVGSLMGDGSISPKYQFLSGHANFQYSSWLYERLKRIASKHHLVRKTAGNKTYESMIVRTFVTNDTVNLRDQFYPNGLKIVPYNCLFSMDALAIAVWYMDDGGTYWYKTKTGHNPLARIFTLCFSENEHDMMIDYFKSKWGIVCYKKPHKSGQKNILCFSRNDSYSLFEIIRPHFCDSMLYKVVYNEQKNIT